MILPWGGSIANIPSDYLFCDGSAVSRTTYSALFAVISTIHGVGDGSTTFNLPDRRNATSIGAQQDDSGVPKTNVTGSLTQSGDGLIPAHLHTAGTLAVALDFTINDGTSAGTDRYTQGAITLTNSNDKITNDPADKGPIKGGNILTGATANFGTGTKVIPVYKVDVYVIKI